ncbi:hypothetical protein ACHHYP_13321 [Achlya hypogyna]|uniref:Uncharacterized protein n=1 Tax=Achlya hypogyna TaxID=1202772 RepID=A0A1V9ZFP5_ACHHY|nr:hypothetical protein ACHHYP_13321 [Achlya hypogyna]
MTVAPLVSSADEQVQIVTGATFWATLILLPLAAADAMATVVALGPLVRATEEEIYNSKYSFTTKALTVLESPVHFATLCKLCFEIKVMCFDDADGNGLAMIVLLQLVTLALEGAPILLARWQQRAHVRDTAAPVPDTPESPQRL